MSDNYANYPQPPPTFAQPYGQPPPAFGQPYGQPPPVFTQPYPVQNQPIIIVQNQNNDVQHGCHFLLWLVTAGLWTPCWIGACCGCCCERPC